MPIFFQQDIDENTRLAVWKIEEAEDFFLPHVPLQREITHPHKRLQHLAGRYLLQYLFPDFPISLIKIADTRKPYLEDEAYHFSISHCSTYAAAIVSKNKRVGVDIEVLTHKVQKIMHKFLHPEELQFVVRDLTMNKTEVGFQETGNDNELNRYHHSLQNQNTQLTLLWSVKEAIFKWWSYGHVDFSDMIRIEPFELQIEGRIDAAFISSDASYPLNLQYRLFDGVCLAWVAH